ncbi:exosortase P [Amycolatopsis sp. cmx-8-4]|uniref:exosortase P n=1 Tax=Amycolatopsis sp. cmx-8-4 TaxID=2790947 RepID=UPI00397BCFB3
MTAFSAPIPGRGRFRKGATVGALVVSVLVLVVLERGYRVLEVQVAGLILRGVTSTGVEVSAARETVYFGLTGPAPLGLTMTPECSSLFLLLPLILVAAVMIHYRPLGQRKVLIALVISVVALFFVNQLRLLMIVGLVRWLGVNKGYYWGHTLLGSMVSVFGGAVALVLFVWLGTRRSGGARFTRKSDI